MPPVSFWLVYHNYSLRISMFPIRGMGSTSLVYFKLLGAFLSWGLDLIVFSMSKSMCANFHAFLKHNWTVFHSKSPH